MTFMMKKPIIYINQHVAGYAREVACYMLSPFKRKGKPSSKFVIFGRGRSGSTLLVSLLNSHPSIYCDKEILNRKVLLPKRFIQCRSRMFDKDIYGFKLLSYQLRSVQSVENPENFLLDLHHNGYKIIYLKRNNALRQVLSKMYASYRNKWHQQSENAQTCRMPVNLDELLLQLKESEKLDAFEEHILKNIPHLKVIYENDLANNIQHTNTAKKITEFLSISNFTPKTNLIKITTEDFSDFIENSKQMIEFLQHSQFAKYLDFQKSP